MTYWDKCCEVSELIGVTLVKVENLNNEKITFEADDGRKWYMEHEPDCCESVTVEDVCGELDDLVGSPIRMAEEVRSKDKDPEDITRDSDEYVGESFTWTFYKFATLKGYVTIRWYGESNGYYSEEVDFRAVSQEDGK